MRGANGEELVRAAVACGDGAQADEAAPGGLAAAARGWGLLEAGRVEDALAAFANEAASLPAEHMALRVGLAHALLVHDGPAAALRGLDAPALRSDSPTSPVLALVDVAEAEARLAAGDPDEALPLARRAAAACLALGWTGPGHVDHRVVEAAACLALGRRSRARAAAEEAVDVADAALVPARRADARRALAAVLGPRHPAAEPLLEAAVFLTARPEARLAHAHALADLGRHRLATGDRTGARPPLRKALDAADRAGARVLTRETREALVAAGGRPRRPRLTGAAALTPAEHRVAALAADGLSNREIAERLWVTVSAVEFNLSRAYAKLGVPRAALADALARP